MQSKSPYQGNGEDCHETRANAASLCRNDGNTTKTNGKVLLLDDFVRFGSSSNVVVSGQFLGSLHGMTGAPRWVTDSELRKAIDAATFDHARSPSVDDLLERIEIDRAAADDGLETIAVTLKSPNERGHFPF